MPTGPNGRKLLEKSSAGDDSHFAGNDYDILTYWFEDTDLTAGVFAATPHPAKVNTPTTFRDNKLKLRNPNNTKSISIRTLNILNDHNVYIPLIDEDDDFMLLDHDQSMHNKTISLSNGNVITVTGISTGDLLKGNGTSFVKMPRGGPGQILTVTSDGLDLAWEDPVVSEGGGSGGVPDDNSVTTAKIVDLAVTNAKLDGSIAGTKLLDNAITTSKILDGAVTNAKLAGSITGSKILNDTITVSQIANTTITGTKIANSTITSTQLADNAVTTSKITDGNITTAKFDAAVRDNFIPNYRYQKSGQFDISTATAGSGIFNGILTSGGTGSFALTSISGGTYGRWTTGSTTNDLFGTRTSVDCVERQHDFKLMGRFSLNNNTLQRAFIGFVDDETAFRSGTDPLNAKNGIGIFINFAVSSNVGFAINDGVGATQVNDYAVSAISVGSNVAHTFEIVADEANSRFRISVDGNAYQNLSTNIPAASTEMSLQAYTETATGAARELKIADLSLLTTAGLV